MLDFAPQSIANARERLGAALEKVWDMRGPVEERTERPGLTPANVFDFPDGLRLIISKELHSVEDGPIIHMYGSLGGEGTQIEKRILKTEPGRPRFDAFANACRERYEGIGGEPGMEFVHFSEGLVPHFIASVKH